MSINLALSSGRSMINVHWYNQANNNLRAIQEEEARKEDMNREKENEVFREMCKEELAEIRKTREKETAQKFLKFILEKYSSKSGKLVLTEQMLQTGNMKKTLLKVIRLYHPDKQPQNDLKWCFMAEEISKYLNSIYESFK